MATSSNPRFGLGRRLQSVAATLGSIAVCGAAHAATPDLVVLDAIGPQTVHVGQLNYVQLNVWNVDEAYAGAYQAEILLSADAAYDGSDLVVQTLQSNVFAPHNVFFTIPSSLPGGHYRWIARVLPVAGETEVANNVYVGQPVFVLATDLAIVDPAPIVFQADFQEPLTADAEIEVENLGNADSILLFDVEPLAPTSWLQIDVGDGFAIEGGAPAKVAIHCDATGLPFGSFGTTLRFTNVSDPNDFEDVEIRLDVGNQRIVIGDRMRGQIGEPGETDEVRFDGLAGTKLILTGHVLAGNLKFLVTLIAPSGGLEHVVNYKNSSKKVKKIVILEETGEYRMVFSGKNTTTGSYRLKTDLRFPALGRSRVETVVDDGSGNAILPVLLHAGARLDVGASPGDGMAGPPSLGLLDKQNIPLDVSAFLVLDAMPEVKLESFLAPELGEYRVMVSGLGQIPGNEAVVRIFPIQPPKGNAKVYVP